MKFRFVPFMGGMLLLSAGAAQAQNGTVSISGSLIPTTCAVSVNNGTTNSGTANGTVTLAPIAVGRLATAATRGGRQNWSIIVGSAAEPCVTPSVRVAFRNTGNVNAQGRLNNTGTATNVNIAISSAQPGTPSQDINLTNNTNSQTVTIPAAGIATLTYAAEYYATGRSTAGTVTTSVQYDLVYP